MTLLFHVMSLTTIPLCWIDLCQSSSKMKQHPGLFEFTKYALTAAGSFVVLTSISTLSIGRQSLAAILAILVSLGTMSTYSCGARKITAVISENSQRSASTKSQWERFANSIVFLSRRIACGNMLFILGSAIMMLGKKMFIVPLSYFGITVYMLGALLCHCTSPLCSTWHRFMKNRGVILC